VCQYAKIYFVTINRQLRVCFIHVGRRLPINKRISHSIHIAYS